MADIISALCADIAISEENAARGLIAIASCIPFAAADVAINWVCILLARSAASPITSAAAALSLLNFALKN